MTAVTVHTVQPATARTRRRFSSERRLLFINAPSATVDTDRLTPTFIEDILTTAQQAQISSICIEERLQETVPNLSHYLSPSGLTIVPSLTEAITAVAPTAICFLRGDVPHLPAAFIAEAFGRLAHGETDLVLGPLETGGHYLIGAKTTTIEQSADIPWGTPELFLTISEPIRDRNLRTATLPPWYRIGTSEDLNRLQQHLILGTVTAPGTAAVLKMYQ